MQEVVVVQLLIVCWLLLEKVFDGWKLIWRRVCRC